MYTTNPSSNVVFGGVLREMVEEVLSTCKILGIGTIYLHFVPNRTAQYLDSPLLPEGAHIRENVS